MLRNIVLFDKTLTEIAFPVMIFADAEENKKFVTVLSKPSQF